MANTSPPNTSKDGAAESAKQDAGSVRDTARRDWDEAKARASEDLEEVKREARHEFDHAREAAGEFAEGQKNYAADKIDGLASAFERVGTELRGEQEWVGRYAGDIADRLGGFASHARSSSVDDLLGDVERFGRQQPTAFLAGAALLGFAATRFLSASADRRSRNEGSRHYRASSGASYGDSGAARESSSQQTAAPQTSSGSSSVRASTSHGNDGGQS